MSLPADYHTHTPLCRHATGEPAALAAQAVRRGLKEMGFSDHAPMPRDDFDDWRMRAADLDRYVAWVEQARLEHPDLAIKLALEVDYLPGYEDWIQDLAARHPWDYLIGSVHYISESWAIDNPAQIALWKGREPFDVWRAYFERLTLAADSGLFDIIGHADLCKKFAYYPRQDCTSLYTGFLRAVQRRGLVVELNTAGLRKECREIYPSPRIVHMAAQLSIPICFGSDAHAPNEVGLNFAEAVQLARSAGYTHYSSFTNRQRQEVPL